MAYLLKKNNDKKELFSINKSFDGYSFKPKIKKSYLNVKKVTIVDPKMIDKILTTKFNTKFKNLMILAARVIDDEDATDADTSLVLDEISLVRGILLNRYQKFLSKEKEELFLKKLRVLENQLRLKEVMIKEKAMYLEYENQLNNGRSR